MFPLLPSKINNNLSELILKIKEEVRVLEGGVNPFVLESIERLMLPINSYYTNAMEGNPSKLSDIEKAVRNDFSTDKSKQNYQLEHIAHIEVQKLMMERLVSLWGCCSLCCHPRERKMGVLWIGRQPKGCHGIFSYFLVAVLLSPKVLPYPAFPNGLETSF